MTHVALFTVSILLFKGKNSEERKYTLLEAHSCRFLHLDGCQFVFRASAGVRDVNSDVARCTAPCAPSKRGDLTSSSSPGHWLRSHWATVQHAKNWFVIVSRLENKCTFAMAVYLHRSCRIIFLPPYGKWESPLLGNLHWEQTPILSSVSKCTLRLG